MKNSILILVLISVVCSCATKVSPKEDLKGSLIEGNDMDVYGCRASAGNTWSVLRKECIRIFEKGIRLNLVKEQKNNANSLSAFIVFDEQRNKAELFLPNQKRSIVLVRNSEGQPWVYDGWHLISSKGYVLKKGTDILYTGQ